MSTRFRVATVGGVQESPLPTTPGHNGADDPEKGVGAGAGAAGEEEGGVGGERKALFSMQEVGGELALYEEDYHQRPKVSQFVTSLLHYTPTQPGSSNAEKADQKARKEQGAKMGALMGVFLPCIQNIFGVLFFIRLSWIVGMAGVVEGFFIVFICCSVTFLTSISLSAIATNGMVPAGGPYYMISRNLGPELGGAVGILFYLGTTVAGAMYITGAVEIFLMYLVPDAQIFEDMQHNFRVYGTAFLLVLGCIVMAGVKVVNKFALPCVILVVLCIICTFIGAFVNFGGNQNLKFCTVGDYMVDMTRESGLNCSRASLERMFCGNASAGAGQRECGYFQAHSDDVRQRLAIPGMGKGIITDNAASRYLQTGEVVSEARNESTSFQGDGHKSMFVFEELTTSFMIMIGVFFPSCTGIMAGSNRSGDLRDASQAIPRGTIAATLTTSAVYLSGVILMGASIDPMFIRDKFGASASGSLVITELAVPHKYVLLVGCFLSTVGAGMQSLTGAPRLFQAIAKDGVLPILKPFAVSSKGGEPLRAIFLTLAICEVGILIAALESITALITQFFLMCYMSVNAACALQSLLRSPGWRPRFKYYHWSLSLVGGILCAVVMFVSEWRFALAAIAIGVVAYKYIEYRGAEQEWGDGLRGLGLSGATYALLNLEGRIPHTKNWRPQLLVLCGSDMERGADRTQGLMFFCSQLKAGKGLTVLAAVIQGRFAERANAERARELKEQLKETRDKLRIKGFCEVLVCDDVIEGISSMIQTSGLGALRHNTVMLNWPDRWQEEASKASHDYERTTRFVETVRLASAAGCAVLVPKNITAFPSGEEKVRGTMDVWWVVHDGGMLMLLPFLLRQHRTWRHTALRIFTIAQMEDNSLKMKRDLETFLYHLRISAEVFVIEMLDSDISEYTYERTMKMEERYQYLRDLQMSGKDKARDIQFMADARHAVRKLSTMNASNEGQEQSTVMRKLSRIAEEGKKTGAHGAGAMGVGDKPSPPPAARSPPNHSEMTTTTLSPDSVPEEDEAPASPSAPLTGNGKGVRFAAEDPELIQRDKERKEARAEARAEEEADAQEDQEKGPQGLPYMGLKPYNVRRMHTAMKLNELMRERSSEAQLVIVNLPGPPRTGSHQYYMEFIEALTEGIPRVLLVKGTGQEVVTIYS